MHTPFLEANLKDNFMNSSTCARFDDIEFL